MLPHLTHTRHWRRWRTPILLATTLLSLVSPQNTLPAHADHLEHGDTTHTLQVRQLARELERNTSLARQEAQRWANPGDWLEAQAVANLSRLEQTSSLLRQRVDGILPDLRYAEADLNRVSLALSNAQLTVHPLRARAQVEHLLGRISTTLTELQRALRQTGPGIDPGLTDLRQLSADLAATARRVHQLARSEARWRDPDTQNALSALANLEAAATRFHPLADRGWLRPEISLRAEFIRVRGAARLAEQTLLQAPVSWHTIREFDRVRELVDLIRDRLSGRLPPH